MELGALHAALCPGQAVLQYKSGILFLDRQALQVVRQLQPTSISSSAVGPQLGLDSHHQELPHLTLTICFILNLSRHEQLNGLGDYNIQQIF